MNGINPHTCSKTEIIELSKQNNLYKLTATYERNKENKKPIKKVINKMRNEVSKIISK